MIFFFKRTYILIFLCSLMLPLHFTYGELNSYRERMKRKYQEEFLKCLYLEQYPYFPYVNCEDILRDAKEDLDLDYFQARNFVIKSGMHYINVSFWLVDKVYHNSIPENRDVRLAATEFYLRECHDIASCMHTLLIANLNWEYSEFEDFINKKKFDERDKEDALLYYERWIDLKYDLLESLPTCSQYYKRCEKLLSEAKEMFDFNFRLNSEYFLFRHFIGTIPSITEDSQKAIFEWIDTAYDREPPCNGASGQLNIYGGGFVADTASVAYTVFVESDASVCDVANVQDVAFIGYSSSISENAQILKGARIYGSKISGHAKIDDMSVVKDSEVSGNSQVLGNSEITDSTVSGDSLVNKRAVVSNSRLDSANVSSWIPEHHTWTGMVTREDVADELIYENCHPLDKNGGRLWRMEGQICFLIHKRKTHESYMANLQNTSGQRFDERNQIVTVSATDNIFIQAGRITKDCFLMNCWKNAAIIQVGGVPLYWPYCEGYGSDSGCDRVADRWRQALKEGHQLQIDFSGPYYSTQMILGNGNEKSYYGIDSWRTIKKEEN